ncbi:MAG TPA: SRPBCC family protein [Anaerolineales bacterium]|jgi:uncharacterized membrane protein|nr:SRPBCC family protein [Anaerolineales bacterium]
MTKITRDVHIKAPVEKVFDLIYDPNNLPEIWSSMLEIKNVKESNLGGYDYTWAYKMSGMHFEGKSQVMEFLTNRRLVMKSSKGIDGMTTWDFQRDGDEETHLLFEMEYEVPASLLNRHVEKAVIEENEHEIEAMLQNVKSKAELEVTYA